MNRLSLFLLISAAAVQGQEQKFADLQTMRIGYRTLGTLNAAKSNAVLFPSWFGGTSQSLLPFVAQDRLVDPAKHFVILVDALGNGVSTSPSNTPRMAAFTIQDMVESEYRLVTEVFGIRKLHAVIGISMGGMQAFAWAVSHPGFVERIVPIIGSPKMSTPDLLLWKAELSAIEAAVANGMDPKLIMPAVMAMHTFASRTPEYAASEQDFAKLEPSFAKSTAHPLDWASQLRAMMGQDVTSGQPLERAVAKVTARMLIVVATQDHMVNPKTSLQFAQIGGYPTLQLSSNCGHAAFSCEQGRLSEIVRNFLERDVI